MTVTAVVSVVAACGSAMAEHGLLEHALYIFLPYSSMPSSAVSLLSADMNTEKTIL